MIAFLYTVSILLAFLLGRFLPKEKVSVKAKRKKEELLSLKEIQNFLTYDGNRQE